MASQLGHVAVVKTLLKEGNADPNISTKDGITALTVPRQLGHAAVVKVLIKGNAQVDTVYDGQTPSMITKSARKHTGKFINLFALYSFCFLFPFPFRFYMWRCNK